MHKRFVATTVLAAALLFSQGGNFLVAALCPHLRSGTVSCETQMADPGMSHEGMGHIGMEHEMDPDRSLDPHPDSNSVAIGQRHDPCSHCAVHSSTIPRAASLKETETAKRSNNLSVPVHDFRVAPVTERTVAVLSARAHGPPGEQLPRYILLDIFRI